MQHENEDQLVSMDTSAITAISSAEIDRAIATAHKYPRSLRKFRDECLQMATLNENVASECFYSLPRKEKNGETKNIEGPSVRLAEIVASAWGNCRVAARVVSEDQDFVTAQGVFHDLERNVAISFEVRRRISGKFGRFSNDMIAVTGNAASSLALRNAVFKGVPKAFWSDIYDAARKTAIGDAQTLSARRQAAIAAFAKMGVREADVLRTLGVKGIEEITLDHIATLRGYVTSIRDGETSVDAIFAPPQATATAQAGAPTTTKVTEDAPSTPVTQDAEPAKPKKVKEPKKEKEEPKKDTTSPLTPAEEDALAADASRVVNEPTKTEPAAVVKPVIDATTVMHFCGEQEALPVGGLRIEPGQPIQMWNGSKFEPFHDQESAMKHCYTVARVQLTKGFMQKRLERDAAMALCGRVLELAENPKTLADLSLVQIVFVLRSLNES